MNYENQPIGQEQGETQFKDPVAEHEDKIARLLASIRPGYTVAVSRSAPSWCAGYLERIELGEDQGIDFDYLAETWGGQVLRLRICDSTGTYRGGCDIKLGSYPPRFRGRLMKRFEPDESELPPGARLASSPAQIAPVSNGLAGIEGLLGFLGKMRSDDLKSIKTVLDSVTTDQPVVQNGIGNIVEMARQMKELQGIFGGANQAMNDSAQPDDQAALFRTIGEIAKGLLAPGGPQQSAPIIRQHQPQHARPLSSSTRPVSPGSNGEGMVTIRGGRSLAAQLAALDPADAADACFSALSRMSPEQKDAAIGEMVARLSGDGLFSDDDDAETDTNMDDEEQPEFQPAHS
jgi:hypothetical protein